MLFSTEPKTSLSELFDREMEIERFRMGINERLVLVLGLRRVGKSSLILSVLNSMGIDYVFIDVRKLFDEVSKKIPGERLYEELRIALSRMSLSERVRGVLSSINLSLGTVGVRLSMAEIRGTITSILEALNSLGRRIVLVFDEAQYLRYSTIGLRSILAYTYDHLSNITLVLTGSEVGLLHDFLGMDDPSSELYGRYYLSIELKPFTRDQSIEFLKRGFKELNVSVDDSIIVKAVDELDGIVGWLVYFGKLYLDRGVDAIYEVKEMGAKMVMREVEELFNRSQYYKYIMEAIATLGRARWVDVNRYVTAKVGRRPTNATLSRNLNNLIKMGFVIKNGDYYMIQDPMIRYAVIKVAT
ncbi:AAA family ATPase [Caldivirga maquilingensis]|uniref:ATPase n=1 Tax=Caldivirga maquilingensis (strain ATCC 700844 / DSM 13496 / JCM 10307 / IC-167) TaxID=397948 RepID=A8MBL7_CALMQ|nr:ATP-binding protein [Caldivirga maquilingensis]ABW02750.1 ATPase [Caldivirga maquilingensis IC-167]